MSASKAEKPSTEAFAGMNTSFVTSRVNTKAKCFNWIVLSENVFFMPRFRLLCLNCSDLYVKVKRKMLYIQGKTRCQLGWFPRETATSFMGTGLFTSSSRGTMFLLLSQQ